MIIATLTQCGVDDTGQRWHVVEAPFALGERGRVVVAGILDQDVEAGWAQLFEALGALHVARQQLVVPKEGSGHGAGEREEVGGAILVQQIRVAPQDVVIRCDVHGVVLERRHRVAGDLAVSLIEVVALGVALMD